MYFALAISMGPLALHRELDAARTLHCMGWNSLPEIMDAFRERTVNEIESSNVVLGQIYESLAPLAQRIHQSLTPRRTTLWVDARGMLELRAADGSDARPRGSVIGTYDAGIAVGWIEADLRIALRQRASAWIIDWDIPAPAICLGADFARKPKRRRRAVSTRAPKAERQRLDMAATP